MNEEAGPTDSAAEAFQRTKDALTRAAYRAFLRRDPDPAADAKLTSPRFTAEQEAELVDLLHLFMDSGEFKAILADEASAEGEPPATPVAFVQLRRQIQELVDAARGLERRLPSELRQRNLPLDRYDEYHDRWIRDVRIEPVGEDRPMTVLVDARTASLEALQDALDALALQSHGRFSVLVGVTRAGLAASLDILARLQERCDAPLGVVVLEDQPQWMPEEALAATDVVVVMRCGVLHPDALRRVDQAFQAAPGLIACYGDEDRLSADDQHLDWRLRAHVQPQLRGGFDGELLLQTPYVGALVAFTRDGWRTSGTATPAAGGDAALDAARRLLSMADGRDDAVGHVPAVLISLPEADDDPGRARAWSRIVAEHLKGRAKVEPHSAAMAPSLPGALRVRWAVKGASAVVIIPTRDGLGVLKPCVDSVLASLDANKTRARIEIIDHDSRRKETKAYLNEVAQHPSVTVRPFSGPFNWALMNNISAREAAEEVLVFLNNDTRVISPDWLDELASLARRPDVGAVGARLLYADDDIQHAGFLALDEPTRFLMHDGLLEPASSPGYLGRNLLTRRTVAVTGACMAVGRAAFSRLGGFDASRFHVEANDVDFCFRADAAGLKVLYAAQATLYHLESKTRRLDTPEARRTAAEAAERLWSRWGERICPDPWYNPRFDRHGMPFERLRPL